MTLLRSHIVNSARSFIGTPWRHQGRSRAGVDCVGLVYAVADDLGIIPEAGVHIPPYRTQPDASLVDIFARYMDPISPRHAKNGSVLIFGFGGSAHHAGIISDVNLSALIHAYAAQKKVVVDTVHGNQKGRRILRAFDYRGVQDG